MIAPLRWAWHLVRKVAFWVVFALVLVASNLALLTADAFYDATKRLLWSTIGLVADIGQPTTHRGSRESLQRLSTEVDQLTRERQQLDEALQRARSNATDLRVDKSALERETRLLQQQKEDLDTRLRRVRVDLNRVAAENTELLAQRSVLNRRVADLEVQSDGLDRQVMERIQELNDRSARRTSRMITANVSSMAVEAVPYAGVAAIVGVTFLEVRDACQILADTREMSQLLSGDPVDEVAACGYSPAEFWELLRGGPDVATCRDLSSDMPAELQLDCLSISRPGELQPETETQPLLVDDITRPGE